MRCTIRTIVLGVVLALAATIAQASGTSRAESRAVVLFAGDSNIILAAQKVENALSMGTHADNGYVPAIAGRGGVGIRSADCIDPTTCATTNYWPVKIGSLAGKITADAWVTDLGINDSLEPGTETTEGYSKYGKKIDFFMALANGTPVFWTTLPCSLEPPEFVTGCQQVNYSLSLAPARWPNLILLNWHIAALGHPEYVIAGDVHYTPAGYQAWASLVADALDARFPPP